MVHATRNKNEAHAMQCMEVWGGNQAIDNAVSMPGLDAWIYSQPYKGDDSGGDIHYVSSCATGRISRMLVADVSGHGTAVSDMARTLRRLMGRHVNYLDQTRFLRALNREFAAVADGGGFATALVATYWAPTDYLTACNAGHPRPLWRRARDGAWAYLDATADARPEGLANLPLGVAEPTAYGQFGVTLEPGDLVLIYTDSLLEAAGADRRQLGESGLLDLVGSLDVTTPELFVQDLLAAVSAHRAGAPAADDVTVLLLRHNGVRPPRMGFREWVGAWTRFTGLMIDSARGRLAATPWPEMRLETVGGAFLSRLNRRWGRRAPPRRRPARAQARGRGESTQG